MKSEENKPYIKAGITALAVIIIAILCVFLIARFDQVSAAIGTIGKILMPFVYGAVLAYILAPLCSKLEQWLDRCLRGKQKKLSAALSVILSLLFALIVISLVVIIIVPSAARSVISLLQALPDMIASAQAKLDEILANEPDARLWLDNLWQQLSASVKAWTDTSAMPFAQSLLGSTVSYFAAFVTLVKDLALGFIITIYLLFSRRKFAAQARMLLHSLLSKRWVAIVENEVRYADRMFNGFFMGKLLDSAIVGVLCFGGCLLLGLPYAPLISVIVGVTNIIPFFGPFIGAIPCALLLLIESPVHCLIFLVFILVLQQLDGNVIGPRILGDKTGLSGFWVTFAILLFGGLWGLVGMLVAIPLFAVIYDIIKRLVYRRLRKTGQGSEIEAYNNSFHLQENQSKKRKEK